MVSPAPVAPDHHVEHRRAVVRKQGHESKGCPGILLLFSFDCVTPCWLRLLTGEEIHHAVEEAFAIALWRDFVAEGVGKLFE